MTNPETKTLRDTLSANEKIWFDEFVRTEGKPPESMWQLMQYGSVMQEQQKQHRTFWNGVFGL